MNDEQQYLINRVIVLPFVLKLFAVDQKEFENLYVGNIWLDKLDFIIKEIQTDIPKHKEDLFNNFRIIIQNVSNLKYKKIQGKSTEIITFTPAKLRTLSSVVIADYLYGSKAKPFKKIDRQWKVLDMQPPDVDLD